MIFRDGGKLSGGNLVMEWEHTPDAEGEQGNGVHVQMKLWGLCGICLGVNPGLFPILCEVIQPLCASISL